MVKQYDVTRYHNVCVNYHVDYLEGANVDYGIEMANPSKFWVFFVVPSNYIFLHSLYNGRHLLMEMV